MKRAVTLKERQTNNASIPPIDPSLPGSNGKSREQVARDAAEEYFKHYRTPLTITLQSIFGTEFFARAALLIDPITPFRNVFGVIALPTRWRQVADMTVTAKVDVDHHTLFATTFGDSEDTLQHEKIVYSLHDIETFYEGKSESYKKWTCGDSLSKDRGWDYSWNSGEFYNRNLNTFGILELTKQDSSTYGASSVWKGFQDKIYGSWEAVEKQSYDRYFFNDTISLRGPITSVISGDLFHPDLYALREELGNKHLFAILPEALANRKEFDLAREIGELKDIPQLVRQIGDLRGLISRVRRGELPISSIDKEVANLNLAWEFGVKTLYRSISSLIELPTKVAKRVNYLISRLGKVTTGRSIRRFENYDLGLEIPTFKFNIPDGFEVFDENVTRNVTVEIRCVVNQTIQFPSLAVPDATGTAYQKLLGGVTDIGDYVELVYQLTPFSWLVDWFAGIGDYIKVMNAVYDDSQLINYGFLTVIIQEEVVHTANFKSIVRYRDQIISEDVNVVLRDENVEFVQPYKKVYTRKHQYRNDIGNYEGVKTFGSWQNNLSDFQTKILGSLVAQRL